MRAIPRSVDITENYSTSFIIVAQIEVHSH